MYRPIRRVPRSQAGEVNTMWLVVVMILWIGTLAVTFSINQDVDASQRLAQQAIQDKETLQARFDELNAGYQGLSDLVGYRDLAVVGSKSDIEALRAEVGGIKADLGNVVGETVTLETAVQALRSARRSSLDASASANTGFEQERQARQAAVAATSEVEATYRSQVAQLQSDLRDEQQRADNQSSSDQRRIDELLASEGDADQAARTARRALDELKVKARRELASVEATVRALTTRSEEREPDAPDGRILAVSGSGAQMFIDVGGRDGLKRGTRFAILRTGKTGELIPYGTLEVREVESDMARCGLVGESDPFDPILPGDLVRNPHFVKGQMSHFFLLGDFPLTLSRDFVTRRLDELGAQVDATLGTGTDVLVLGHKSLVNEDAPELTDTDEYRLAGKLGLRIMRVGELARFLRY